MARACPVTGGIALYIDCLECEQRRDCTSGKLQKERGIDNAGGFIKERAASSPAPSCSRCSGKQT